MPRRPTGVEESARAGGRRVYRGWVHDHGRVVKGPWGTMPEAIQWRAQRLLDQQRAARPASELTLTELADQFFDGAEAGTVRDRSGRPYKPSTLRGYRRAWERAKPALGAEKLREVRRSDLQRLVDGWAGEGLAPSTIRNTLDPIRAIFRRAVKRELIDVNPALDLDLPFDDGDEIKVVPPERAAALVAAAPACDRAIWAAAFYAGLRRGELRALHCEDIGDVIAVTRSWDDKEGQITPKTRAGRRKVPIVAPLRAHLAEARLRVGGTGRVFVFEPSTVRRRAIKAWEAAKLEPVTLHQARHTFASFMIAAGANAKALSTVMGHASISITFDRYGHLMPGGEAEVGELLDGYLGEVSGK